MYKTINRCRCCGSGRLREVMDMGLQPLANDFKKASAIASKSDSGTPSWLNGYYPLHLLYCEQCGLGLLREVVEPKTLYQRYAYITSRSDTMNAHFNQIKGDIISSASRSDHVLEIGSNDGAFLKYFSGDGRSVIGIDPSENLCLEAEKAGISTICQFFGGSQEIYLPWKPDIIIARHVMCHIDDWTAFVKSLEAITHQESIVAIEVPYAGDMISNVQFDTVYHEHLSYMTHSAMHALVLDTDFYISEIHHYDIHGGSCMFILRRKNGQKIESSVVLGELQAESIHFDSWLRFAERATERIENLRKHVADIRASGKTIAGYGASAKSTVWMRCCGFDLREIECIYDNTPYKQFCNSPGTSVPIKPPEHIPCDKPDYLLLFAWNYADEIIRKENAYLEAGGHFIIPE